MPVDGETLSNLNINIVRWKDVVVPDVINSGIPVSVVSGSITNSDPFLDIPAGNVSGQTGVNKFGRSTNVDSGVDTDIWDRANATDDDDIWTAPTQARIHNIASNDAADDGNPVGNGARTIQVFGLTDWNTKEINETITMNGTGNVPTANAYVIIHRMKVLTFGSQGPNVGVITATAQSDATVTAQINAGEGQTQMAVYGIPSAQTAYMTQFYASLLRANASNAFADVRLLFNPIPDNELAGFLVKHSLGITTTGNNPNVHPYQPYNKFSGPGILKLQAAGSAADLDVSGGFDLILVDN